MKLLSYKGTRPGIAGVGNRLVRLRLMSPYSHSEVLFEPGDNIAHLMPDNSLEPDADGALWCASSSATDSMPDWGNGRNKRAGCKGGVRFKRITPKSENWDIQDYPFSSEEVGAWFAANEGACYDWRHIMSFLGVIPNLLFQNDPYFYTCTEACAAAAGFAHSDIFNPHNLPVVVDRLNRLLTAGYSFSK